MITARMRPAIRGIVRRVPLARDIRDLSLGRHSSLLAALDTYAPNSAGAPSARAALTIQSASALSHLLAAYCREFGTAGSASTSVDFPKIIGASGRAELLSQLFNRYGSDKSTAHDYHHVYAAILNDLQRVDAILEVGLGTNHEDVVSNMSSAGVPGASLRAFRDYLPGASIYGADIDVRVLFAEDRIETHHVDQTDIESVKKLSRQLPQLDLVIDDGLHAPDANVAIVWLARLNLRPGGWIVVEDISPQAADLWQVLSIVFKGDFESHLIEARGGYMWAGKRV